ncbi:MAG: hypothetical protein AB1896_17570 [Thermodesulfobacteriota bacterium]
MRNKYIIGLLLVLFLAAGCSGYQYKPVPFKAAEAYPNHVTVFGAVVAAKAWTDEQEAWNAFGFNIRGAGITPVQVVVDNKGDHTLEIVPEQTRLMDTEDNIWDLLPAEAAYERIDKHVAMERMVGQGSRSGLLGGLAGGILGAAYGVVTGTNVGDAAMRGAAAGAAVGAVMGGAEGLNDPRSRELISQDLQSRSLKGKPLVPQEISHGFLFFPGEVKEAAVLRLRIRDIGTGEVSLLELNLRTGQ